MTREEIDYKACDFADDIGALFVVVILKVLRKCLNNMRDTPENV